MRQRVTVAILALGGQGGGVLADWLQQAARLAGWHVQGTSVPGVAQRTGSTVYYVELFPASVEPDGPTDPVMAQMPVPGDVDLVLACELMEAGRAMLRGFVSEARTTLIGSTHRIYAISEKSAPGDGRGNEAKIIAAANTRARRFIGFDMEAMATQSGSVISSVMLGAVAGAETLPLSRAQFEEAIRHSGIAVGSNLKGFALGFAAAQSGAAPTPAPKALAPPQPSTAHGRALKTRIEREVPEPARDNALHGVARMLDYQGVGYGQLYLDRLGRVAALDRAPFDLSAETARYLALWMSYEDTIRIADLKTRASRLDRVRQETMAAPEEILRVVDFLHPRYQEFCDTLPTALGRWFQGSKTLSRLLSPLFARGRLLDSTSLSGFVQLRLVAALRPFRPWSLRYGEEQKRIEDWLSTLRQAATTDLALAIELARCPRLIKGYGDTFARGLAQYHAILAEVETHRHHPDLAATVERLRTAALREDSGK